MTRRLEGMPNARRILIIGPGGAGKSTLAARLGRALALPVIHLDAEYWSSGWTPTPKDEWGARVGAMLERDAWIMDGNYGGTLMQRLAACDTVIFLDFPRRIYIRRVIARWLQHRGRSRPDMAPECPERLSMEFLVWLWRYRRTRRPEILARLAALSPDQRAIVLTSPREVERFVEAFSSHRSTSPAAHP